MNYTNSPGSVDDLHVDKDTGAGVPGTAVMAADMNQPRVELMNLIEDAGFTGSASNLYQIEMAIRAHRKDIGELITSEIELTPVPTILARSTTHPEYDMYNPIIPRHDANHDITTSEVPQSVIDVLCAHKITCGSTDTFSGTLASGTITVPAGGDYDVLLARLMEFGLINQWYVAESAAYATTGALWTGARQYCVTIAGANYAITGVSIGSRTIKLASPPSDGAVSFTVHPHRIAGYTDRARLRRISGETLVAAGDITGEYVVGGPAQDRGQRHIHWQGSQPYWSVVGRSNVDQADTGESGYRSALLYKNTYNDTSIGPSTDGTNGTPRTGKTTNPRALGVAVYTHLGVLLNTTWITA